jgi:hypothetical protein
MPIAFLPRWPESVAFPQEQKSENDMATVPRAPQSNEGLVHNADCVPYYV